MKGIFGIVFIGFIAVTLADIECPNNGVILPNPDDCTSYYRCEYGFPVWAACHSGLYFDIKTLSCVDPAEATCAGSEAPIPPEPEHPEEPPQPDPEHPEEPAQPEPEYPEEPVPPVHCPEQMGPDDNVLLPNPKDCTTFYQCVYGHPTLQRCPKGLHFNAVKKYCDYPGPAKCTALPSK